MNLKKQDKNENERKSSNILNRYKRKCYINIYKCNFTFYSISNTYLHKYW